AVGGRSQRRPPRPLPRRRSLVPRPALPQLQLPRRGGVRAVQHDPARRGLPAGRLGRHAHGGTPMTLLLLIAWFAPSAFGNELAHGYTFGGYAYLAESWGEHRQSPAAYRRNGIGAG